MKGKHNQLGQFELKFQLNTLTSQKKNPDLLSNRAPPPPQHSPHSGPGGSNQLAYYKLPGWFREACLVPEGYQANAIALPPHSSHPASLSIRQPPASNCMLEQLHVNTALRHLDMSSSKPGWLRGALYYVSLDACHRNAHIWTDSVTSLMRRSDATLQKKKKKKVLKVLKSESDEAQCPQTPRSSLKDNNW